MDTSQTKKYAFILGRERDLCLVELRSVLGRFGFCFGDFILSDNVAIINLDKDPRTLIDILGGTTKIFEMTEFGSVIPAEAGILKIPHQVRDDNLVRQKIKELISERATKTTGKFNFGFSAYGRHRSESLNPLGLNIKKDLKGQLSLRFIALKEKELSTIVSSKNNLATEGLEVGFFNDEVGILIAVTDPEAWSERDYGKPRGDKFSGMVPPKLARIMINLALGPIGARSQELEVENSDFKLRNSNSNVAVIDPFCGSGNILLEALMLGCDIFGSDISEKAVEDSKENVEWLLRSVISSGAERSREILQQDFSNPDGMSGGRNDKIKIIQADAASQDLIKHLELEIKNYGNVVVVTEPYLGEPKKYLSSIRAVRGEYEKVKELYLSFLSNLGHLSILENITICLIFPLVETAEKTRFSLYSESVDEIKKIGYTELAKPLVYGRDYQVVKREIALLKLT